MKIFVMAIISAILLCPLSNAVFTKDQPKNVETLTLTSGIMSSDIAVMRNEIEALQSEKSALTFSINDLTNKNETLNDRIDVVNERFAVFVFLFMGLGVLIGLSFDRLRKSKKTSNSQSIESDQQKTS